jgi:hypothetical protein
VFLLRAWQTQMRRRARPVFSLLPGGPTSSQIAAGTLTGSNGETVTITRTTQKRVINASGVWVDVGSGKPGVDVRGLNIEPAATNNLLHCRDFTQAAWVRTNCDAEKLTTGIDGAEDSASTLTATAANATAIQSRTLTSAARVSSFFVRRRSGTGAIEITRNNGTNWATLNASNCIDPLTGAGTAPHAEGWVRVSLTSTLANPAVGLRLTTSGDSIDVDFAQDEVGAVATTPILTGAGTAARNADIVSVPTTGWPTSGGGRVKISYTPMGLAYAATNRMVDARQGVGASDDGFVVAILTTGGLHGEIRKDNQTAVALTGALTWTAGTAYEITFVWDAAGQATISRSPGGESGTATNALAVPAVLNVNAGIGVGYDLSTGFLAPGTYHSLEVYNA